ncbi:unnamed protein product [Lymnaea stagnalis]|uniref:Uncharacterized protein n=1 Tax=Lymnaea stagnalis TaxID=6523 RepID=A0AAV2HWH0_LYMST
MDKPEDDLEASLKSFPCMIFLEDSSNVDHQRLKDLQKKLQSELDMDNDYQTELVQKLNVYTWVEFKLDNKEKAKALNNRVLELDQNNVTALGNLAYMSWMNGEEDLAKDYLRKLQALHMHKDAKSMMAVGKAQMGYAYSRLGGVENIENAIEIYTEVLEEKPDFVNGKLCLGLLLRRITHNNLSAEFKFKTDHKNHFEKAATLLFEVGVSGEDGAVQGRAYAELALLLQDAEKFISKDECREIFRQKDILELCEEALKYGYDNARTVAECGRILKDKHLDKAIPLLERSCELRNHTIACHHLGICYERKAKEIMKIKMTENNAANDSFEDIILNPEDELVKKAISMYEEAIKVSCDTNMSAMYSLGLCLKACCRLEQALGQFNKITVTAHRRKNKKRQLDHIVTLINSYEQAGLCQLQLTEKQDEAEKKLMQAVSLAAVVVASRPDLNTHTKHIWNALTTIEDVYDQKPPESIKILIGLLSRIGHHGKVLQYFEKLRELGDDHASHPDVMAKVLDSFMALREYDKAYTTLTMLRTQALFAFEDELTLRINLFTAASRLQTREGDTESIFKDVFDTHFKQKGNTENGGNRSEESLGETSTVLLDVLMLHNDLGDQNASEEIRQKFLNIINTFFGLEVSCNLEGCFPGGVRAELLLKEIQRSKLIVFLFDPAPFSSDLRTILPFVRSTREHSENIGSDILVAVTDNSVEIPSFIEHYSRTNLVEDIKDIHVNSFNKVHASGSAVSLTGPMRNDSSESLINVDDSNMSNGDAITSNSDRTTVNVMPPSIDANSSDGFTPEVNSLMQLFCLLINRRWPTLEKIKT